MITDFEKALDLVTKNWVEYFNLAEELREREEILNIVLRADDLFANGSRYFHHLFWRDDKKIAENNLLEYEDVLTLIEEAQDSFTDNLSFPDKTIPPYLMNEDEVFERYNLHIEIDDFDGEFREEFGEEEAENIRDRLEQVIDDSVLAACRGQFKDERATQYISLDPQNPQTNHKQLMAACLIHIDNLFLAPKEFFTEKNLYPIFEEHFKALNTIPRHIGWSASDSDMLFAHINSFIPLSSLKPDSPLIQSMMKIDINKKSLGKIIELPVSETDKANHLNDDLPLEDYSEEALVEHLAKRPFDFKKLSEETKNIRSVALSAVKGHGHLLANCKEEFRSDKEFVLAAVSYNGSCIQYALGDLQEDLDFIKQCVKIDGYTLEYIKNNEFLNNKELALLAIDNYYSSYGIINKLSDELKNDPDIILAGLKKDRSALAAASDKLHNDRNFILKCVKLNGCSLGAMKNADFKNDREIVELALDNLCDDVSQWESVANGIANNIGSDLKKDREIANKILSANPYVISYFSHFSYTKEEVLNFVKLEAKAYRFLTEEFKNDSDVINQVIEKNPLMFSELNEIHKQNKDLVLKSIKLNPLLYVDLNSNFKADEDILNCILNNPIKRTN